MLAKITNSPRDYAWGSSTLLADLTGRAPTGAPEAEIWYGDHAGSPAIVETGERLDDFLAHEGLPALPFLLKLLGIGAPLSIQVHPNRAQALEGFARETAEGAGGGSRNYPDDNHKPEIVVALSERVEALCGLRPIADTLRLLEVLGESTAPLRAVLGERGARGAVAWLLEGNADLPLLRGELESAESAEFGAELACARRIAAAHPDDPGILVALLMNRICLARGEGAYLGPGQLHAYVSGLAVEIMAASDNVLRGGLTRKRIDVPELLKVMDPDPRIPTILRGPDYLPEEGGFRLRRTAPEGSLATDAVAIVLATAGLVSVTQRAERREISPGEAVVFTGEVDLGGVGEVFVADSR